jgi:hypothetical protein
VEGMTPPTPGASPYQDTVDNLDCAVEFARWALASWSVCHIKAPPTSGEPAGSAEAKAHRCVPRAAALGLRRAGWSARRAHAGDATFGVFPHRLASGSPQGLHRRAPLGRPGEGVAHLAQALGLRQARGALGLMQENLNPEGLHTRPPAADAAKGIRSPANAEGWGGSPPTGVIKIVKSWSTQIGL